MQAKAQTNPASITITGACLNSQYVLNKIADDFEGSGKPAYLGEASVTIGGQVYTDNFAIYYKTVEQLWVFEAGQPYLSNSATTSLPPMSGWQVVDGGTVGNCTGAATLTVLTVPPSVSISPANPATVCAGVPVSLTATAAGIPATVSYAWSSSPAGFSGSGNVLTQNAPSVSTNTTYIVSVTASNGAFRATSSVNISVKPVPTLAQNGSSNPTTCGGANGSINFTTTNLPNGTYQLTYTGAGSPKTVVVSSGAFSVTGLSAGSYANFSINNNGCTGAVAATVSLTNPTPTLTVGGNSSPTTCSGTNGSINFTTTNLGNGTYTLTYTGTGSPKTVTVTSNAFSLTGLGQGTYSGFSLSGGGCSTSSSTSVFLNDPTPPTLGLGTPVNPSTCGGTNGSIGFTTNVADGTYQLNYTGTGSPKTITVVSNSFSLTGLGAGIYSNFSLTRLGCTATVPTAVTLTNPPTPTLAISTTANPTTCGGTNGSIGFTTNLPDGTYSLSYTGAGTPKTIRVTSGAFSLTGLTAGAYSNFSITNNGCTGTSVSTINLTDPTSSSISLDNNGPLSCLSPTVTLTATAGFTSYTFSAGASQQGGSASNTATVNVAGTYSVTATNASGCLSTTSVTVVGSTTATPVDLTVSGALSCSATSVTLTATPGFTSYVFSVGATQQGGSVGNTAMVNVAGTYSVTATNASGCLSTTNVTVVGSTSATPVDLAVSSAISCLASNVTLTATAGFTSYSFSAGAIQQGGSAGNTATVNMAGTYSVTATNASGCLSTTSVTVVGSTTATPVNLAASGTLSCLAPSITLTATAGFSSYTFSAGAAQQGGSAGNTATVNVAGTYSVTATNASGCLSTTNVTVVGSTTATPVGLTVSGTLSCSAPSATLTATAGFTSYTFSAGAAQQSGSAGNTATVNTAGIYSVTAVNASGCLSTTSVTVVGSTTATPVSLAASGPLSCSATSVTLTATAGFASYTFSAGAAQQGGSAGNTATVNVAGTYFVSATNASGCLSTTNVTVVGSTTATPVSLAASGPLSCSAPNVTLTATPGFTAYVFSAGAAQQGGSAGNAATVNAAGTYSVTATNASGCLSTTSVTVVGSTTATPVSLAASGPLSCSAPNVTLTATPGFSSYIFSAGAVQQGGSVGNTATVNAAGTYSVTATNASGCQSTTSVTVVGSTTASPVDLTASGPLSCSALSVTLTATPGFTSYVFSAGAAQQGGLVGNTATVNAAGTYSVTATNASGCLSTTSVTVVGSTTATPVELTVSGPLSCSAPSITLTATAGFTRYVFSAGAAQVGGSAGNTATVNAAGTYSVTATNASGCLSTTSVTVVGSTTASPVSLAASGPVSCSVPSVTLTATAGFTNYIFSAGATQQGGAAGNTATANTAGTYSVTAVNASGCQSTTSVTVVGSTTSSPVSLSASGPLSCSTTTVTLTATAGFTSYVFSTSATQQGGSAGNTATVSTTGVYSVTATNADGCASIASVAVTYQACQIPGSFTITSVNLLSCSPSGPNRRYFSFTPVYSGLTGQPISFSVVNQLPPTTLTGPYSLDLYTDNPVIVLKATQQGTPGEATFSYNWLAACMGMPAPNTPPSVVAPIPPQVATINQTFNLVIAPGTFTDAETPSSLTYAVTGLPPGLGFFAPNFISGTPSTTLGTPFSVTVTATDPGGLSASTIFPLTVNPASTTASFGITGANLVNCTTLSPNRRAISFTPVYSGATGQPISFSVVNELPATTASGPYSLSLYTDNPVIVLKATQQNTPGEASFSYNWLEACNGTPSTNTPPTVANPLGPQSATVNQGYSFVIPSNTFTDTQTPGNLVLSVSGLPAGLGFTPPATISGTPSTTLGTPFSVTVTATDPGGLSTFTTFNLTVNSQSTTPPSTFAITGATLVNCSSLTPNRRAISFNPVYSGLNGQPITFSVVNELAPTTTAGPYQLNLYTDNPVIVLKATQQGTPGEATFNYNWLEACNNVPSTNTPPTVANPIGPQSATINVSYTFNIPTNTFNDAETPSGLALSMSGLPVGLTFNPPATISGTPSVSMAAPYSVTVTATDPGGLSTFTTFNLTVNPNTSTTTFAITGATLLSCTPLSANRRSISFTPVYSGATGQPISFSVVNELAPTTNSSPYQLNLYTDNPVIVLTAKQEGTPGEASFSYNWLAACNSMARVGAPETPLQIVVLGNPVVGESVEVGVKGAEGRALRLRVVNAQGRSVHEETVEKAGIEERVRMNVGTTSGIYLLEVRIPGQRQVIKLVKP